MGEVSVAGPVAHGLTQAVLLEVLAEGLLHVTDTAAEVLRVEQGDRFQEANLGGDKVVWMSGVGCQFHFILVNSGRTLKFAITWN